MSDQPATDPAYEPGDTGGAEPGAGARLVLVKGDDASLVSRALDTLLAELGAPSDDALDVAVEEHRAAGREPGSLPAVLLDALYTPPFLAERRIVLLRDAEELAAGDAAEIARGLSTPFDPNVFVIVVTGRALGAPLGKIVRSSGREIDASAGSGRARTSWLDSQLRHAPVRLGADAARRLGEHLGEDVARLHELLEVLAAAYGVGARVGAAELEPFLGEAGGVPPWELTDALAAGDIEKAVAATHRMLGAGGRHPFQLLATLQSHFGAMLRLDGSGVKDRDGAAALLKLAPYPAQKALEQSRRLGHDRIARAIGLLADADRDLRGAVGWPEELVIEVLVARLAQLSPRPSRPRRAGAS